eukprot:c20871_g1_i1.p1 GENE.c20871_g1_i1~~c20871_g1_i1.p1  ORF type:complete len:386 (-),score=111.40 c20871_g1_i1:62-1219(-)
MTTINSAMPGLFRLNREERIETITKQVPHLSQTDVELLHARSVGWEAANRMVENVLCVEQLPLYVLDKFVVNNKKLLVPIVPSPQQVEGLVAIEAAAAGCVASGGFNACCTDAIMIGQIQILDCANLYDATRVVMLNQRSIGDLVDQHAGSLKARGGGYRGLEVRMLESARGKLLVVHIKVDVCDAMGANAINRVCEGVAPMIAQLTGGRIGFRILSNLNIDRRVCVQGTWKIEEIGAGQGADMVEGVWQWLVTDPDMTVAHHAAIMTAIDGVLVATANDTRAAEAATHAFASMQGGVLTRLWVDEDQTSIHMTIDIPMAVGVVGGAIQSHSHATPALRALTCHSEPSGSPSSSAPTARELSCVLGAVGLAAAFAHVKSLVSSAS